MRKLTFFSLSFSVFFFSILSCNCFSQSGKETIAKNGMVVSADSIATAVGLEILKKGGNAIDAAIATGFALAVTYPVAGNLGGGGFMVIRLVTGETITLDYREKAPLNAFREMYLDNNGNIEQKKILEGVTAAGVPGSVDGLITAWEKFGSLNFSELIQPAIELAENGFFLSNSTAESFNRYKSEFEKFSSTKKLFVKPSGKFKAGDLFVQTDLAATLTRILLNRREGFYGGLTAELLTKQMQENGGYITNEDLQKYSTVLREPVVATYRDFKVISMGPPSSGGIALIQALNILENKQLEQIPHNSVEYIHFVSEALKYVYADRSEYLGDPDFFPVPLTQLISKGYGREIFNLISDSARKSLDIKPGEVFPKESTETTHYSVYDKLGNAVSVTTTINSGYGAKIVVEGAGFFLNNEMDDFSAKPGVPNQFGLPGNIANQIVPEKRMLSSMTPTIILKNDKPFLILGSPGGSTIITVVLQVILNTIDFKMSLFDAMHSARFHHQWLPDEIQYEEEIMVSEKKEALEQRGHKIGIKRVLGLVEAILIDQNSGDIIGISDPRGFGYAGGY